MKFDKARSALDTAEKKDYVTIEDILKIACNLSVDVNNDALDRKLKEGLVKDLPIENTEVLIKYLRKQSSLIREIVKTHWDTLSGSTGASWLERTCNILEKWEQDVEQQVAADEAGILNLDVCLDEKEALTEKLKSCEVLERKFEKYTSIMIEKKAELGAKKKQIVFDMLQYEC